MSRYVRRARSSSRPSDGNEFGAVAVRLHPSCFGNSMTGEQLVRLHQNPFYIQAYQFFMDESTTLSEMLEQMGWTPVTTEQRETVRLQCEKTKQTRLVLQQLGELVLSAQERSPQPLARPMEE